MLCEQIHNREQCQFGRRRLCLQKTCTCEVVVISLVDQRELPSPLILLKHEHKMAVLQAKSIRSDIHSLSFRLSVRFWRVISIFRFIYNPKVFKLVPRLRHHLRSIAMFSALGPTPESLRQFPASRAHLGWSFGASRRERPRLIGPDGCRMGPTECVSLMIGHAC